ncbi:MAG: DUF4062 domain-containing protein [Gammaproteobacteria bacterium]|nr:DUF4062 domain-containing protein [Gammaproteobacteria bacterium]
MIDELNGGFGDGAGVRFVALGWEDTLATTGRRAQGVINQDIDRSDVFVLALHRRWGQEAPDAEGFSSYTEEEFHRALDRWKETGAPEIFVFFKHVDPLSMADAGPQFEKVLAFRKSLEDSRQVLYRFFEDDKAFAAEVNRHLRAYAGAISPRPTRRSRRWSCRSNSLRRSRRPSRRPRPPSSARRRIKSTPRPRPHRPTNWRSCSPKRPRQPPSTAASSERARPSPRPTRVRPTSRCCFSPTSFISAPET